jgi:hypothetical protein
MKDLKERLNITTLRSKNKEELIEMILNHYREFDSILDALEYVQSDIELIKVGDAWHVHDNP